MGVEQYCLLRVGDTNFKYNQIQFDGSGVGVGKLPEKSNSKLLDENIWYHVAVTYDTTTGHVCIYVNGKIQSETFVNPTSSPINLAMRALHAQDPATYPSFKAAYQFFIGRSYEDTTVMRRYFRSPHLECRSNAGGDMARYVRCRAAGYEIGATCLLEVQRGRRQYHP